MITNSLTSRKFLISIGLVALLILLSYWIFFAIYRTHAFNVIPRDYYEFYLLYILGEEGGVMPPAGHAHRLFSVAVAVPFYYILPFYKFSLLENVDITYLRAIEALAMATYISLLVSSALIYSITTKKFGGSASSGLIASLAALLFLSPVGGVDPIGIMLMCVLIFYSRSPVIFGILVLISIGFNEKISLLLSILMVSRYLLARDRQIIPYAILSAVAFTVYLSVRSILDLPGHEIQMEVSGFLVNAWNNALSILSLKRIAVDVIPVCTLGMLYFLAAKEYRSNVRKYNKYFSITDISALVGIFMVSLAVDQRMGIGRVAMYCAPFYLPLAAIYVEKLVQKMDIDAQQTDQSFK